MAGPIIGSRIQLRVSLYPWVPDPEPMARWIKADFEAAHPQVELRMRPPERSRRSTSNPEYVADLAYDVEAAVAALTGDGPDAQDVVEVDTSILPALVRCGAVAPFPAVPGEFLAFAADAVRCEGVRYGVPHWACGSFVIFPAAAAVDPAEALRAYLEGRVVPREERTATVVTAAAGSSSDAEWYPYALEGVQRFARGGADALVGYSEQLNAVFRTDGRVVGDLAVAAAPESGEGPRLFTDALVMSPRCTAPAYLEAVRRFAAYCISDRVYETLMMSRDVGAPAAPRYLLPCTASAFGHGSVAGDRLYQQLRGAVVGTSPSPGERTPRAREPASDQVRPGPLCRVGRG
jgi:thiamine pyridinylase